MRYLPNTPDDRAAMLAAVGAGSVDELFRGLPESVRLKKALQLPEPLTEMELQRLLRYLASQNANAEEYACFLGAGAYDHHIPPAVDEVASRSEFYTSYTPYQAEISQGVLQSIFEFQTAICELTGLEVANASHYDGATATAEGVLMAASITRRKKALLLGGIHPQYAACVKSYCKPRLEVTALPPKEGTTDLDSLKNSLGDEICCVAVQHPNFFGLLEPVRDIAQLANEKGCLVVAIVDPISLGILEPPGEWGADIAVGEGQTLGIPLSFGGPYLGFMAARSRYMRQLPGRLVGLTGDGEGKRGYVLTLQAREQHIRREKATSNICSNQALCALRSVVYLSLLGKRGLRQVAELCARKAHYAHERLTAIKGYLPSFPEKPFFKEFAVRVPRNPAEINKGLFERGIIGGYPLGRDFPELADHMLFAVTEKRTREEIDSLVAALEEIL